MTQRAKCCRWMRIQACLLTVFSVVGWIGATAYAAGEEGLLMTAKLGWLPEEPKQGEVVYLWVIGPNGVVVERGEMLSRPLRFYLSPEGSGRWNALSGIDMGQKPASTR